MTFCVPCNKTAPKSCSSMWCAVMPVSRFLNGTLRSDSTSVGTSPDANTSSLLDAVVGG